ncbi:MAG: AAA family ATPase [Candidatus Saccharimonadales bacterium]
MSGAIKIKEVKSLSLKSFKDYTGPSCEFDRSNIFFAPNGHGKSSLASGLKNEFCKAFSPENLRIYDKDFVDSQLLLEENGNIRGVKANFGKKDVDLELKIKTLDGERSDINKTISDLEDKNKELVASTETAIEDVFKRRKGKASIAQKTHKDGVHEKVVQLWIDDYHTALKKFPDQNYDEIDGKKNFGDTLDVINGLKFTVLPSPVEANLNELRRIAPKTYASVDIPSSDIVSWLETGMHLHEDRDICAFCGNTVDTEKLTARVETYIKNEQSVDRKRLESFKETLQLIYRDVKLIVDNKDSTIVTLDKDESAINALTELENSLQPITDMGTAINEKIENMQVPRDLDVDALKSLLESVETHIETMGSVKSVRKAHYEEMINRLEVLVKGAIGYEISTSSLITSNQAAYKDNLKEVARLRKQSTDKKEDARKLRESKSDLADFANYLNEIFKDIGIDFKLILSGESYILQHTLLGVDLAVDDISEGERNLLALMYFYYEMLSDDKKNLKSEIEFVVIDDPATSMDDENRFYILELVKSIIDNKNLQSFVLTHSWRDFCDLCYAKDEQQGVKKFEISKTSGESSIELSRSVVSPYKRLYKEVYDFSQKSFSDVSADEVLHIPNTMRRVLEEYIRFNFGIDLATQTRYNEIAEALFEDRVSNISASNEARLKTLLSVCNILSHGTPHTRSVSEIHTSARFLINRMEAINKYHHTRMKQG